MSFYFDDQVITYREQEEGVLSRILLILSFIAIGWILIWYSTSIASNAEFDERIILGIGVLFILVSIIDLLFFVFSTSKIYSFHQHSIKILDTSEELIQEISSGSLSKITKFVYLEAQRNSDPFLDYIEYKIYFDQDQGTINFKINNESWESQDTNLKNSNKLDDFINTHYHVEVQSENTYF